MLNAMKEPKHVFFCLQKYYKKYFNFNYKKHELIMFNTIHKIVKVFNPYQRTTFMAIVKHMNDNTSVIPFHFYEAN